MGGPAFCCTLGALSHAAPGTPHAAPASRTAHAASRTPLTPLLLLMVLIWGANFSVVKIALRDFPELAFNACRLVIAASIFLIAIGRSGRRPPLTVRDWSHLAALGIVGHMLYQLCFLAGVKRTSVGNAALIIGVSPILVSLMSAAAGHERVPWMRWAGAALSFAGLYLIVGHQVDWSASGHLGDGLMLASAVCWAAYSVGSVPLLRRHSPLVVTGLSITIGAIVYIATVSPALMLVEWRAIGAASWLWMAASAVFALAVAYLIWYTAVQRIGSTRTSMYSYLTPIAAMLIAAVWLGEAVTGRQAAGAAAIFAGLFVTRLPAKHKV
jgi:drug/metabolite transporter (DMT)-like permease